MVRTGDHPLGGSVTLTGYPVVVDSCFADLRPAPEFGQHTEEVLADCGITTAAPRQGGLQ
jgi:crotonobetainyl-CoA:carnitine CoA-transferase CaiB-like acyl-CoA transferase